MAESRVAIYGAIGANAAIAVTKFVVAGITGSSAMLSEGIHSAVDTGNGILLLVGTRLSERPASAEHPFGHGKELYFWSLIVAVLIFGLGGGVSFYEGVLHWRNPAPMEDAKWNYIVLGYAALFEGTSLVIAVRQFLRQSAGRPFWRALHRSKDPTTFTVMAEDSAALAGLAIAAAGVYASHAWHMPRLDGVASMLIGVLLYVQFRNDTPAEQVAGTVAALEKEVRQQFPVIRHIYVEAATLGKGLDRAAARPAS
jgi:cation diffusion facilitator family transporter